MDYIYNKSLTIYKTISNNLFYLIYDAGKLVFLKHLQHKQKN